MQKVYLDSLNKLKNEMEKKSNSCYLAYVKVAALTVMNMRYEKIALNKQLNDHPYSLTKNIIEDALTMFNTMCDASFIESGKTIEKTKSREKELKHQQLFNEIWNKYNPEEFESYIDRYVYRIKINNLTDLIKDKVCVDLGCGNGVFCFALLRCGAKYAAGIDYGENSVLFAKQVAKERKIEERTNFLTKSVYDTPFEGDFFDFAVQNGVFHHLDDYEKAIVEVKRILKKGGWFWYYTDGEGGISYDLWDASVEILRDVPGDFIENILVYMGVSRNKIVHLTDGLSATYAHTSWDKITSVLSKHGFADFKRLTGGFDTDFDLDKIQSDPYGKEKFGEGDLRILCRLAEK
ncbi:class I SAM-dependent methyltransferase [Candidatus Magnetominusculus xianensis]|uniref:SAM-dependent methyltransferase n=1 Tax=Candidatus Magnetominusculus xianensis TaxID=1748249 RepID=A0ABR5SHE2_9BACT|nr:class I SAM-dependent methyltransferase [Candidatus Magnetominusculus xianensis]KWT87096.1 SAM-dependent methyltransferase [Candidatus Magnetominusculus xianensis]MBF0404980.1 class I SAM-dependent methyltransferase [Nitrospirota bacterium]